MIKYENKYERFAVERISISEIQRNLHKLDSFDIVEIIDKKRNKVKGYYIEGKYASLVEEVRQKIEEIKQKSIPRPAGALRNYADPSKISGEKSAWSEKVVENYRKEGSV